MSPEIADRLIDIVRNAARVEILPHFRNLAAGSIEAKTDPSDLVTIADRAAEARITREVASLLPQAMIIGEEAVSANPALLQGLATAELAVLVDPIDGTWNFVGGSSLFGVILAVVEGGRTTFGLLYDPVNDGWVTAHAGEGAFRFDREGRRERLRIHPEEMRSAAFMPLGQFDPQTQRALFSRFTDVARLSSLYCSCHEYWLLAHGAADFGVSAMLNPWDHAAGELIIREAGGHAAMLDGSPYRPGISQGKNLLVARSPALWKTVRDQLAEALFHAECPQ